MSSPRDDFGSVRPIRRLNRLTQALLAIALAVVVNFLASLPEFRLRHDITADRRHSLATESAETVRAADVARAAGLALAEPAEVDTYTWDQPVDATRARAELGWTPRSVDFLAQLRMAG